MFQILFHEQLFHNWRYPFYYWIQSNFMKSEIMEAHKALMFLADSLWFIIIYILNKFMDDKLLQNLWFWSVLCQLKYLKALNLNVWFRGLWEISFLEQYISEATILNVMRETLYDWNNMNISIFGANIIKKENLLKKNVSQNKTSRWKDWHFLSF